MAIVAIVHGHEWCSPFWDVVTLLVLIHLCTAPIVCFAFRTVEGFHSSDCAASSDSTVKASTICLACESKCIGGGCPASSRREPSVLIWPITLSYASSAI